MWAVVVASQEGEAIVKRAPFVDVVFGPQALHRLPQMIDDKKETAVHRLIFPFRKSKNSIIYRRRAWKAARHLCRLWKAVPNIAAFAWCLIPAVRNFPRPLADVLTEVANLAQQGVKEINLLGQNVNAYRGLMDDGEICDFAMLLRIVHEIPGIERMRFTASHPREFSERIIGNATATYPSWFPICTCRFKAAPDRVLSAMKRGYTALEYKSIIRKLRAIRPDLCLSSDFIVGFPGETEAEFEQTLKLVRDIAFDLSFVFIYSPRPGTQAANLADDTPHEEKVRRLEALNEVIEAETARINQTMIGTVQRCLVEGVSKKIRINCRRARPTTVW